VCAAICLGGFAQWVTRDYAELLGIRAERVTFCPSRARLWAAQAGGVSSFVPGADAECSGPLVNTGDTLYFGALDRANRCRALDATETPPGAVPLPGRVAACRLHGHAQGRL